MAGGRKTYPNPEELRTERKQLIIDSVKHDRKPRRIPIMSHAWTWKACDANYNLEEYIYDYEKRFDAVCQHHEKYEMDFYIDLGYRNQLRVNDCFGRSNYYVTEDKQHIGHVDHEMMDADDYENILRDGTLKYLFERAIPDRYGYTDKQKMMEAYGKAAREYLLMDEYNKKIADHFVYEFGVPLCNAMIMGLGTDIVQVFYRGIVGLAKDMRRQPDNVSALIEMLENEAWPAVLKHLDSYKLEDNTSCFPIRLTSLSHTILNKEQFGRFSWPGMKRLVDEIAKRNLIGILYFEGGVQHLVEYLQEIPEGVIGLLIEKEDPVELKKQLPNVTIIGGYPSHLLYTGTQQQCIDKAKKMIDEAAYDGNYIFAADLMLSYPEDAKGENMKVVVDFVKEYGKF